MITDAGYDLEKLVWVISREIAEMKHTGYKPVRIGWWHFKRPVHLPRKHEDRAELFEKP